MSTTDTDLPFVVLNLQALQDVAAEALAPLNDFSLADDQKDGNPPDHLPPRTTTPSLLRARIIWEVRRRLGEEAQREAERIIVDRDPRDPRRVRVMLPEQPGSRLFVPLTAAAFGWFLSGIKDWEVRKWAPRWLLPHTRIGRRVELRRGYSGPSLWGTITARRTGQMTRCLTGLGIQRFMPCAVLTDWSLMCARLAKVIGSDEPDPHVVAFEVKLHEHPIIKHGGGKCSIACQFRRDDGPLAVSGHCAVLGRKRRLMRVGIMSQEPDDCPLVGGCE